MAPITRASDEAARFIEEKLGFGQVRVLLAHSARQERRDPIVPIDRLCTGEWN